MSQLSQKNSNNHYLHQAGIIQHVSQEGQYITLLNRFERDEIAIVKNTILKDIKLCPH